MHIFTSKTIVTYVIDISIYCLPHCIEIKLFSTVLVIQNSVWEKRIISTKSIQCQITLVAFNIYTVLSKLEQNIVIIFFLNNAVYE